MTLAENRMQQMDRVLSQCKASVVNVPVDMIPGELSLTECSRINSGVKENGLFVCQTCDGIFNKNTIVVNIRRLIPESCEFTEEQVDAVAKTYTTMANDVPAGSTVFPCGTGTVWHIQSIMAGVGEIKIPESANIPLQVHDAMLHITDCQGKTDAYCMSSFLRTVLLWLGYDPDNKVV